MLKVFRCAVLLAASLSSSLAIAAFAQEEQRPPPADGVAAPQPATPSPPPQSPAPAPAAPAAKVLERTEIQGVLGRQVLSRTGEDMGRIVEVIVERAGGQPRAVIIDFGGFLGVGVRKIAVDWNVLQFASEQGSERVTLDLTRDQVKAAPEYKEGRPIVVLTRAGPSEPVPD
jgi:hypothetical protein